VATWVWPTPVAAITDQLGAEFSRLRSYPGRGAERRLAATAVAVPREEHRQRPSDQGIMCRMSRRGDWLDKAVAENFFSTLKMELVYESA